MELLYQYENYLSNYSKSTKETYLECVKLYIRYLEYIYGKVNPIIIYNIQQSDIYNYIAYMQGLSPGSIRIRLYAIKNFYSYLKIRQDYFEDIKLYCFNKKMPNYLSSQQLKLLFNYYSNQRNRLIIYILISTGVRLSEITNLKIENINLDKRYFIVMCKGGKERKVFINKKCSDMIHNYIGDRVEGKLFNVSKQAIYMIVKKALNELGLKGSTHTLRHSYATLIYEQTKDILLVKELLGHESIVSTQVYTHIANDRVKEAVERNPLANYGGIK